MMRTPRFKLTRYDDGGGELYDLSKDPDELENRINDAAYSSTRESLTKALEEWEKLYPARLN